MIYLSTGKMGQSRAPLMGTAAAVRGTRSTETFSCEAVAPRLGRKRIEFQQQSWCVPCAKRSALYEILCTEP